MRWFSGVALVLALGAAACGSKGSGGNGNADAGPPVGPLDIMTDKGLVHGAAGANARDFVGIPFAAPPTGALRFMPPKEADPWSTPLQATTSPPECTQFDFGGNVADGSSEDCLYLNVFAPLGDVSNAPVFLWIYGGGFQTGSASFPLYNGEALVAKTNAIVVAIGYRVGVLGFLAHPAIASALGVATAPPQGLLDQQMAMKWVQRNIAAFGGDPSRITLAGESAGAISVCAQLAMSGAQGLFANAIMESGVCNWFLFQSKTAAEAQAGRLATAVGCTDASQALSCLQGKPVADLMKALPLRHDYFGGTGETIAPVVDGVILPHVPMDALTAGNFVKVPTILGSNLNEGDLFAAEWGSPAPTPGDVRSSIGAFWGSANVASIASHYPVDTDAKTALSEIITDGVFGCPTRKAARAISAAGVPTYLYQFTFPAVIPGYGVVSAHGSEMPYVWRQEFLGPLTEADTPMADTFSGYWGSLMTSGDPNAAPAQGAPPWPKYGASGDQNLTLVMPPTVDTHLKQSICDFWDTVE